MPDGSRACQGTFAQHMQMVAENGRHLFEAGQKIIEASRAPCLTDGRRSAVHVRRHLRGPFHSQVERQILDEALKKLEATHELSRLLLKWRWIGMEDEAKRLQAMVNTLPAEE